MTSPFPTIPRAKTTKYMNILKISMSDKTIRVELFNCWPVISSGPKLMFAKQRKEQYNGLCEK